MGMLLLLLLLLLATPLRASDSVPFGARAGLELAEGAAHVWSRDAFLVYVENDEAVDAQGAAERWGYLYYSPSLEKSRVYSIRGGKILVAELLEMKIEAPPLGRWIDSGIALRVAEENGGGAFRREHGGRLSNMLLMRGPFDERAPDQTTWTLVYTSPHTPALFVLVDAAEGKVVRTWRG
jgi:hypothetical protein